LAALTEKQLFDEFGESGRHLWNLANCIDPREVESFREAKSIGAEETYPEDISDTEAVNRELLSLSVKVARRLRLSGLTALTVTLKVRDSRFKTFTRSKTLTEPVCEHQQFYQLAQSLFPKEKNGPFRLLGISASNVRPISEKPANLLTGAGLKSPKVNPKLTEAMDAINNRFGENILKPATLLNKPQPGQ
jgi:DNA polymerase-4